MSTAGVVDGPEALRRHIGEGSDCAARDGQSGIAAIFGDAEVDQIGEIFGRGDEDVLRLDVAVDQTLRVGSVQRCGDLADDPDRALRLQGPRWRSSWRSWPRTSRISM